MSFYDDFLKELKKKGLTIEDVMEKEEQPSKGKSTASKSKYEQEFEAALNERGLTLHDAMNMGDEDIAPITTTKSDKNIAEDGNDSLLDLFQKGAFSDGYQFGDVTKTILGTAGDVGLNIFKGFANVGEGIGDAIGYGVAGIADMLGKDEFAEDVRDRASERMFDDWTKGSQNYLDQYSALGRTSKSVAQGIGQMGFIMGTGGLGSAAGLGSVGTTILTTGTMGLSGMGSGMGEAYQNDATDEEALTYGLIAGASDALTELIFGGMGKMINAKGLSTGLTSADDIVAKKVSNLFSEQITKNFAEFGVKASAEGLEEVMAGITQAVGKKLTYMSEEEFSQILKDENLLEQFVVGAATSGMMQSGIIPGTESGSLKEANTTGRDFITGLSQNEQAVIDKETEKRIAEQEASGKKLTNKEKSDIAEKVKADMEKGYISTDTIEEALGGETYKTYKHTVDSEDALQKEFDTLNKMKQGEMTGEQIDKRTELKEKLEYLKKNSKRSELKTKLSEEVKGLIQNDRLTESYNEIERHKQRIELDLNQYKNPNARKTAENLAKVLDNSNKARDVLDLMTKVSEDIGVTFTAEDAQNFEGTAVAIKRVKEFAADGKATEYDIGSTNLSTGFKPVVTVDGKVVDNYSVDYKTGKITFETAPTGNISVEFRKDAKINGKLADGSIAINMKSKKYLESIVGHEVTHKLENTEFYAKLQEYVFEYAKKKGEYDTRYKEFADLYNGMEGTSVEAELTADLVGDYLFQDSDFINKLSTENRNVFQKLYDEIKHLLTLATAGSEQARRLEQVKYKFEQAYREAGKAQKNTADGGAAYALESKKQPGRLDPRTVTKADVEDMLHKVEEGSISGNTYIPVRIGTPEKLIYWAEKRRGDVIDNNPIAISADKAYNAMNRAGEMESGRPNKLSTDEIVAMIEGMNDPQYIVYQGANDRYVEVVKFDTKTGDKAFAVIEIGNNKDAVYMNGYEGGLYNILVTTYPPQSGKLKELLTGSSNQVIYDKNKDASQRTSSNTVPSVLNDASFYDDSLPDNGKEVKEQFSLSEAVEETKELMAIHNLTGEKLLKSLKLGGLPMPSIAIARAMDGHGEFGEISLVLNKDAIDPDVSSRNKLYSGDAWTPTYPSVDYKPSEKVLNKVRDKIAGLVPYEIRNVLGTVSLDADNASTYLSRYNGNLLEAYKQNDSMKYAYLKETGSDITLPTKEEDLFRYGAVSNEAVRYFSGKLVGGLQAVEHYRNMSGRDLVQEKALTEAVADAQNFDVLRTLEPGSVEYLEYEQNPVFRAEDVSFSDIDSMLSAARKLLKNGVQQTVDRKAAKELISSQVDQTSYENWLEELFAGVVEKEGIRNNKDYFTPSGNRRSFEALHYEHNLENVIKAMREQGEKGIGNGFGGASIFGASTTEFSSISEMKRLSDRLQKMSYDEYQELRKSFTDRFLEIAMRLPNEKNSFSATDSAAEVLTEAVAKYKTRNGIANYLRRELKGWATYSDQAVNDLMDLVDDIRMMPTGYFEAKPQRAVGFDEVAVFVIPYDADVKLKQELLNKGYPIAEYDPKVEGDRQRVINQFEELKFSLSDATATPKKYGDRATLGEEVLYKPTEDIAPVPETSAEANPTAPQVNAEDLFPDDTIPIQKEYEFLKAEEEDIAGAIAAYASVGDLENAEKLGREYQAVQEKIAAIEGDEADRLASIEDADAPPEMIENKSPEDVADDVPLTKALVTKLAKTVRAQLGLPAKRVAEVRDLIARYSKEEFPSKAHLYTEIAEKFGTYTETQVDEDLKGVKALLRTYGIQVSDSIKGEIADYGRLMRSNFGKVRFSNEGLPVDVAYREFQEVLPGYFPESIYVPTDQLMRIIEVANMDTSFEQTHEIDWQTLEEVTDTIMNGVAEFKQNRKEALANAHGKESFQILMEDADRYVPPIDLQKRPPTRAEMNARADDIAPTFDTSSGQQAMWENGQSDDITKRLERSKKALREEYLRKRAELEASTRDKGAFISRRASELYQELRGLRKGVKASDSLGYLLDHGYEWSSVRAALVNIQHTPDRTVNINSAIENIAREMLDSDYQDRLYDISDLEAEYNKNVAQLEADAEKERAGGKPITRKVLHENIMDNIKTTFREKGFEFDDVLKNAKDLSTFATVDNTPQRVMEKALGYKQGQALSDLTVNKVAQNETEGIRWLNSFTDKKAGLLSKIAKQYNIKPGSKASAAAQMYAEGFYVGENDAIIQYGDRELAADFPDAKVQENIKKLARDPRIRQIYDETLAAINESRTRNAYPEIPRLDNYFLHFRAMEDTFSRLGLPFNPNDIRAKDLPTDLNGVTADLKPGQPYFASAKHREGKRTSFDLLGGLEKYLTSAKNQIYHIDDIQTLRALRNYVAETYGQATGLQDLDLLSDEEAEQKIKDVYGSHLSTFAKFLNEEANVLAGKTALIDRGLEGVIGRRGITFLDTLNRQVGANMVGFNVSSALTNFLAPVQAFAKSNKFDFVKAMAQTASNKIGSIFGNGDTFAEESPVMIRRKGAERFYRTPYEKVADAGYVLMGMVDDLSTELVARTKYNELTRKGMDSQQAHIETDKWVSRLMGDRSIGQQPQLYNSKMLGIVTKFQLEVRNQLDSQFYDTIQEAKVSTEDIQNGLERNAKKAAKITSTFVQLAVVQHLFGKAFESVAGYNPAFDIIEAIVKALGWDDEEDEEDTVLDNLEEAFLSLLGDLPYTSTLTGGRIPIASALPITQFIKGEDQYGNEKSRWDTIKEAAPYYLLPGGYGQIKKTKQGLAMFDDDLPIAGSYTDSGNLRFPVEDTLKNRVQAGLFGQWASANARDYFDNERKPLKENQIQELIDVDLPIREYWDYREELSKYDTVKEKIQFIESLDLPVSKKNILVNNAADRKTPIDLTDYDQYADFEEFDFASKNPEKYSFLKENNISYADYAGDEDAKEFYDGVYSWVNNYPDKVTVSKAVTSSVVEYRTLTKALDSITADKDANGKTISGSAKEKKIAYINSLDIDYGAKLILFKNEYNADDTYNYEIVEYLNGRDDISYDEMNTILKELGFTVTPDGYITW